MRKLLLIALFAIVVAYIQAASTNLNNPDVFKQWEAYKLKYNKTYPSKDEDNKRLNLYLAAVSVVTKHNELYNKGEVTYRLELNQYADWTHDEYLQLTGLLDLNRPDESATTHVTSLDSDHPGSFDWRDENAVTDVRDELNCHCSWAFAATGAIESHYYIQNEERVFLSAQCLLDCVNATNKCRGGLPNQAYQYVEKNQGIDKEEGYTYEGQVDVCRTNAKNIGAKIKQHTKIPVGDERSLQDALVRMGPISVMIDDTDPSFKLYNGGIYKPSSCSNQKVTRAMLLVGYDYIFTPWGRRDYWILQGSMGRRWGQQGYMWLPKDSENFCGIASEASYPLIA